MNYARAIVAAIVGVCVYLPNPVLARDPLLTVPNRQTVLHLATGVPDDLAVGDAMAGKLTEIGREGISIDVQIATLPDRNGLASDTGKQLLADIPPGNTSGRVRRFRFTPTKTSDAPTLPGFQFHDVSDTSLELRQGDVPVLTYNHGIVTDQRVPEKDARRSRGCYIHPVWGLNGEILTDDFPKDHYHHHGIFWTWPHVVIDGEDHDLWADKNIQQRFVRWICRETGPVAAVLAVENGWFVGQRKVMIERVWLRSYTSGDAERSIDLTFWWIPVDRAVTLEGAAGKSYGGLTMRFAPPSREEATITIRDGRTEADLSQTPQPWADYTSRFDASDRLSGAAVMVRPDHRDYPPTWLLRHYGPLCVGWPGVESQTFPPDEPIRLDYRIWIHPTAVDADVLEEAYQGYVDATQAAFKQRR